MYIPWSQKMKKHPNWLLEVWLVFWRCVTNVEQPSKGGMKHHLSLVTHLVGMLRCENQVSLFKYFKKNALIFVFWGLFYINKRTGKSGNPAGSSRTNLYLIRYRYSRNCENDGLNCDKFGAKKKGKFAAIFPFRWINILSDNTFPWFDIPVTN